MKVFSRKVLHFCQQSVFLVFPISSCTLGISNVLIYSLLITWATKTPYFNLIIKASTHMYWPCVCIHFMNFIHFTVEIL